MNQIDTIKAKIHELIDEHDAEDFFNPYIEGVKDCLDIISEVSDQEFLKD